MLHLPDSIKLAPTPSPVTVVIAPLPPKGEQADRSDATVVVLGTFDAVQQNLAVVLSIIRLLPAA